MAASQDAVSLLTTIDLHLQSIDASLKTLVQQRRAEQPKTVASERDLLSKYGNPTLRFMPRDWTGANFKDRKFSECPPALLDMAAETFEWFASQAEAKNERTDRGKPIADLKRLDAARARGWAQRIRDGKHVQTTSTTAPAGWAEEDGF